MMTMMTMMTMKKMMMMTMMMMIKQPQHVLDCLRKAFCVFFLFLTYWHLYLVSAAQDPMYMKKTENTV